jgi:hypothetical protein
LTLPAFIFRASASGTVDALAALAAAATSGMSCAVAVVGAPSLTPLPLHAARLNANGTQNIAVMSLPTVRLLCLRICA